MGAEAAMQREHDDGCCYQRTQFRASEGP